MRKRVLCILLCTLVVVAFSPAGVFAATDYGKVFANLTAADVVKYDSAIPTGGAKMSATQYSAELKKIGYKMSGKKGNISVHQCLSFESTSGAVKGSFDSAYMHSDWYKYDPNKKITYIYNEKQSLIGSSQTSINCGLSWVDKKNSYSYTWDKGATTGYSSVYKLGSSSGTSTKVTATYKKYKDATVLGQKCFVYSVKYSGSTTTSYHYVSRSSGLTIKAVYVFSNGDKYTDVYFVHKYTTKAASFFVKPKGVTFSAPGIM